MKTTHLFCRQTALHAALCLCLPAGLLHAQAVNNPPATATTATAPAGEEVVHFSKFEVRASTQEEGYAAATTLAGNRLNTEIRDIGNAVQVVTGKFLKDIGATNNTSLLQYTTNTEVGGIQGNFAGVGDGPQLNESLARPNENTRIRGLAFADNTRDYFRTEIPWDSYNTDRIDLQRGPNSILFGLGSPAGIINAGSVGAMFRNAGKVEVRVDSNGSVRGVLDLNANIVPSQVALRVAALGNNEKYKQDPAFSDDHRIYGTMRVEPKFLKINGARTIIKGNFESGSIDSNRPRELPPGDLITPWFGNTPYAGRNADNAATTFPGLNRETFNAYQLWDHLSGRPNHGQERDRLENTQVNPAYQPWIGSFGGIETNPVAFFSAGGAAPALWITEATQLPGGLAPDGTVDGNIGGMPFNRIRGINPTSVWANEAKLPFSQFGLFKNNVITDRSVFDFYNNLLDGDTKNEWQKFNSANISVAQTFLDEMFGVELQYRHENYKSGQTALLDGAANAIGIDIINVFADGTPAGANGEPYANGTPNPNAGRPYAASNGANGNYEWQSEREVFRATAFVNYDFTKHGRQNWLTRILGEHTLTGLYASDEQDTDNRVWQRYGILDPEYRQFMGIPGVKFNDIKLRPTTVIYLGPSLSGRASASGAYIPTAGGNNYAITGGNMRVFNSTWIATGVNPGDPWNNDFYLPGTPGYASTQSENPANYIGWTNHPVAITDANASIANRNLLTTDAALSKNEVKSQAIVWQGRLLDKSLAITYGWRKDTVKDWKYATNVASSADPFGTLDLGAGYRLPGTPTNRGEGQSRSYSIMAHLSDLPFIKQYADKIPVMVSFYYNRSTNFRPEAGRVDVYGEAISPPTGKTIDRGILLETRDRRYSLKINRYENTLKNSTSSSFVNTWFIGDSQAWGAKFANVFQYNLGGFDMSTANQGDPQRYNYGPAPGETPQQAAAREQAAIDGWHAWQASVDPRFYRAWSINPANFQNPQAEVLSAIPQGFTVTEDSISKGYEIELNAEPVKNWRLTLNASKTKAQRSNIGGSNLNAFMTAYQNALNNTAAGDLRQWWGTADVPNTRDYWYGLIGLGGEWALKKLQEGTAAPELREWRVNLITNYDVTRGILNGLGFGGAIRYQSEVTIGFPPKTDSTFSSINFDLGNPYKGPSETNFDIWIGYTTKLTKGVTWRIQLNIANLFKRNELIPITVQPDGTPAGYRIAPSQVIYLTNTFEF